MKNIWYKIKKIFVEIIVSMFVFNTKVKAMAVLPCEIVYEFRESKRQIQDRMLQILIIPIILLAVLIIYFKKTKNDRVKKIAKILIVILSSGILSIVILSWIILVYLYIEYFKIK